MHRSDHGEAGHSPVFQLVWQLQLVPHCARQLTVIPQLRCAWVWGFDKARPRHRTTHAAL
eukprot:15339899-Alexandrium_andersonii.AAC.1